MDGADEAEVGLRVAVDDLERNPELPRALEQEVSVERVADGRGGDREDPIGTCPLRDGAEIPERLEGSFDRFGTELGSGMELAREPERGPRVLDHVEVLAVPQSEDDHPRRVRPDIEHGERSFVVCGGWGLVGHGSMLAHRNVGAVAGRRSGGLPFREGTE